MICKENMKTAAANARGCFHVVKYKNYLYLRFLAASDFFLRFTLGFS